ncbi:hypothetical protein BCR44DRAFT_1114716 [Catenaria anguillulae PL171]|uniref:P-loop containing nucleoside triphosphate hydrolase protein n=1 Tax=Catenaria anguillulae PL171 TaxID=765915 RepID=A0A1Y2HLX8_9FUNG|nr:hypothetical protein BCR44DRAFT_1114716 [Catenaria anguillulae PL171]
MATAWIQSALSAVGVGTGSESPSIPSTPHHHAGSFVARNGSNSDIALGASTSAATPVTSSSQPAFSASNLPEHNARARIVIVGDPGTGRSTLLQLLTSVDASTRLPDDQEGHATPLRTASPALAGAGDSGGAFTGVRLHTVAATFKSYWLEIVTLPRGHFGAGARATIYSGIDGVIALYDAAVPRTLDAMWRHVAEVLAAIGPGATILKPGEDLGSISARMGGDAGPAVPVLVVGTKCDLVPGLTPSYSTTGRQGAATATAAHSRAASISEVVGINEFVMSKYSPPPPELFHAFFDQVIAARYYAPSPHMHVQHQQQHSHSSSYASAAASGGLTMSAGASHSPASYSYGAPPSPMLSAFPGAQGQASLAAPPATPLLSSVHTPSVPTPKMHRSTTLLQSAAAGGYSGSGESASSLMDVSSELDGAANGPVQPTGSRRRMVVAVGGNRAPAGTRGGRTGGLLFPSTPTT